MIDLTNYTRWITASVMKQIDASRQGVHLYVEGQTRDTQQFPQWLEARIDGPLQRPCGSKDEFVFDVSVDILCSTVFNEKDFYALKRLLGIASQALNVVAINVLRFGDQPGDDQTAVGCLQLKGGLGGIHVHDFGQIEDTTQIMQGTVQASYFMTL